MQLLCLCLCLSFISLSSTASTCSNIMANRPVHIKKPAKTQAQAHEQTGGQPQSEWASARARLIKRRRQSCTATLPSHKLVYSNTPTQITTGFSTPPASTSPPFIIWRRRQMHSHSASNPLPLTTTAPAMRRKASCLASCELCRPCWLVPAVSACMP